MLGIVFIAARGRKGVRRVGVILMVAGVILVAVKFAADMAFRQLEKHIFHNSSTGQIQQSLTDFLHRVETQLVKVDLWFGVAFVVLAVVLFTLLWFTRRRSGGANGGAKPPQPQASADTPPQAGGSGDQAPLPVFKQPPRPRPPRLIQ